MKKGVSLFLINLVLILLQNSFFPVLFGQQFYANLFLAFAMALFITDREDEAFLSALLGGLITDFLAVGVIGLSSFIALSLLFILKLTKKVFYRNWIIKTVFALIVFFSYTIGSNTENIGKIGYVFISCLVTLVFCFIFKFLLTRILNEKRFS